METSHHLPVSQPAHCYRLPSNPFHPMCDLLSASNFIILIFSLSSVPFNRSKRYTTRHTKAQPTVSFIAMLALTLSDSSSYQFTLPCECQAVYEKSLPLARLWLKFIRFSSIVTTSFSGFASFTPFKVDSSGVNCGQILQRFSLVDNVRNETKFSFSDQTGWHFISMSICRKMLTIVKWNFLVFSGSSKCIPNSVIRFVCFYHSVS